MTDKRRITSQKKDNWGLRVRMRPGHPAWDGGIWAGHWSLILEASCHWHLGFCAPAFLFLGGTWLTSREYIWLLCQATCSCYWEVTKQSLHLLVASCQSERTDTSCPCLRGHMLLLKESFPLLYLQRKHNAEVTSTVSCEMPSFLLLVCSSRLTPQPSGRQNMKLFLSSGFNGQVKLSVAEWLAETF
jgi:hypothetical protein